jgi:hypothetical protein
MKQMGRPVRFIVGPSHRGGLEARGIDTDLLIEAPSLAALERMAEERVRAVLGADRGVALLLGQPRRRRR